MKIAFLSRGGSVFDRRFLEKMVERGHQPFLISYANHPIVDVEGVENHHYPYWKFFHHYFLRSLRITWHLRKLLARLRPDVLHTGWVTDHGFYGALSGFHPTLSMPFGSDILVHPDESWVFMWKARLTLRRADAITCDCELVKTRCAQIAKCPTERIITFPWGVDQSIFRPQSKPSPVRRDLSWEDNEIIIVSRQFKQVYGIEYFLTALPRIVRERPSVRVILAGSGPLEQSYRAMLSEYGLASHVHFAGWLDEPDMAAHLNAADVYVTTSLSDGTSASMLEAMACGLPMVVSDAPAYFEWVQDGVNGFVVPRRDSEYLAERIITLLSDGALRDDMGARNLEIAHERADWEKNFSILEGIYGDLLDGKGISRKEVEVRV
ncbi:MAG: glycosyltransferase family 4 protein [Chloroflexi bacterium]|nr:glycosyltransferase family 4 protein [Chloroflexota bacterium]